MISYEPLWEILKEKAITSYALTEKMNFDKSTLYRIKKGKPVTTSTINELCKILNCETQNIICYIADEK